MYKFQTQYPKGIVYLKYIHINQVQGISRYTLIKWLFWGFLYYFFYKTRKFEKSHFVKKTLTGVLKFLAMKYLRIP